MKYRIVITTFRTGRVKTTVEYDKPFTHKVIKLIAKVLNIHNWTEKPVSCKSYDEAKAWVDKYIKNEQFAIDDNTISTQTIEKIDSKKFVFIK